MKQPFMKYFLHLADPASESVMLPEYAGNPDLALNTLLTLMSSFPATRSVNVAASILLHLCMVVEDARYPDALRECAETLLDTWSNYAELSEENGMSCVH